MTDHTTIVTFLLDETGSMNAIKEETIGGFNQYLTSLQDPTYGPVHFTLIKFDSNHTTVVCKGVPAGDVQPLTLQTYIPGASTPLIDAAYKTITATDAVVAAHPDAKVLIVIQTDGEENASRQYTRADLEDLIKARTAAGWGFLYLGAGLDAFSMAGQLGLNRAQTMSYALGKSAQTFAAMAQNTASYRSSGDTAHLAFTAAQRRTADDRWHQDQGPAAPQPPAVVPSVLNPPAVSPAGGRPSLVDDIDLTPDSEAPDVP